MKSYCIFKELWRCLSPWHYLPYVGGLGSTEKLHCQPALNHKFQVYKGLCKDEFTSSWRTHQSICGFVYVYRLQLYVHTQTPMRRHCNFAGESRETSSQLLIAVYLWRTNICIEKGSRVIAALKTKPVSLHIRKSKVELFWNGRNFVNKFKIIV